MGSVIVLIPRFSANFILSVTLPSEEYILGIIMPVTLSAPKAFTAIAAVKALSIPPDNPRTTFLNPVFSQYSFKAKVTTSRI